MRATFANKLVFAEPQNEQTIKYMHQFRVNVDVFICHADKKDRDWDLHFASSSVLPADIRAGLVREFMHYIRRRVRKGVNTLSYDDFIAMAKAVNIL